MESIKCPDGGGRVITPAHTLGVEHDLLLSHSTHSTMHVRGAASSHRLALPREAYVRC